MVYKYKCPRCRTLLLFRVAFLYFSPYRQTHRSTRMTTTLSLKPPCIWKQTADRSVVAVPGSFPLKWQHQWASEGKEEKCTSVQPQLPVTFKQSLLNILHQVRVRTNSKSTCSLTHTHGIIHCIHSTYCTTILRSYTKTSIDPTTEFCTIQNVSSRLQISYFFNCCHNQIYLSKQISLELLTMEMCMSTEAKTIYHVQESTRDIMTKEEKKKQWSKINTDFVSLGSHFLK